MGKYKYDGVDLFLIMRKKYYNDLKILQHQLPCTVEKEFEDSRDFVLKVQLDLVSDGMSDILGISPNLEIVEMAKNAKFIQETKKAEHDLTL